MPKLTVEMETTLREYVQLQQEEQQLKARKQALQEKLKTHVRSHGNTIWNPEVDGERLKVRYRTESQIDYNEEMLQERLQDRYHALLLPNLKKLRNELPNLENELKPLLKRIGSPSPEKIKKAVNNGTIHAEEFKGAFTKTTKEYISVSVLRPPENHSV